MYKRQVLLVLVLAINLAARLAKAKLKQKQQNLSVPGGSKMASACALAIFSGK